MPKQPSLAPANGTVRFTVEYSDESPIGCCGSARLQAHLRAINAPIYRLLEREGPEQVVGQGERLLKKVFGSASFRAWCGQNGRLASDHLHPAPESVYPNALVASVGSEEILRVPWTKETSSELHDAVAHWAGDPGLAPSALGAPLDEYLRQNRSPENRLPKDSGQAIDWGNADAVFLGHNTVAVRFKGQCLVVDPWFVPMAARYPRGYQPLQRGQLGPVDAVAITHSHPDHFDPGSLLQFHRDTLMLVPKVPKESLLSFDLSYRLQEMGFRKVVALGWWESRKIGDITITALPFYGEQPTDADQLYPEVRNWGNFYHLQTPRLRCAIVADGGQDRDGTVKNVAFEAYRRWGAIDLLFSGYRGWALYPIQYFESSVREYLLFVPPELYSVRQSIMNTCDEAVDAAEAWHARYLVPYADGGAPWFSEIGLGPTYPVPKANPKHAKSFFDPYPERCLEALRLRSEPIPGIGVGSPVEALLLRPGESCVMNRRRATVRGYAGHRWPSGW
jgi:L-ascorbate metabolism protein UlaG (beta-lactamase superfamily)